MGECQEILDSTGGNGDMKASKILNLDGLTDIEEEGENKGLGLEITKCESKKERNTRRRREFKNEIKDIKEEVNPKERRGRKSKADAEALPKIEMKSKLLKKEKNNQKQKSSDPIEKKKDNKLKAVDKGNESTERPRRGRSC